MPFCGGVQENGSCVHLATDLPRDLRVAGGRGRAWTFGPMAASCISLVTCKTVEVGGWTCCPADNSGSQLSILPCARVRKGGECRRDSESGCHGPALTACQGLLPTGPPEAAHAL